MTMPPNDPSITSCEVWFKIIKRFREGMGEQFDGMPFLTPRGNEGIPGADLHDVRNGCELWEVRGWHWVCQCPKPPSARLRFMAHGDAAELAGAGYRVTLSTGGTAGGKSNASAYSLSFPEDEPALIDAIELPAF
jgi:hypothetical protein